MPVRSSNFSPYTGLTKKTMKYLMRSTLWFLPLLVLLLVGCSDENPVEQDVEVPDFRLPDLEGNTFQLSSTQGKVVVLTFFATDCHACQEEAPRLVALHDQFAGKGLEIVAVALRARSVDEVKAFKEAYGIPYRIVIDNGVVEGGYGVSRTPTTYIIDRDVKAYGPYPAMTEEEMANLIKPFL